MVMRGMETRRPDEASTSEFLPLLEDRVFDANVLLEFTCAICLHLISDPRQCSQGHTICLKCFQELARHPSLRMECPTCRVPMDRDRPNRNLTLENLLAKLDIYCRVRSLPIYSIHLCPMHTFALICSTERGHGEAVVGRFHFFCRLWAFNFFIAAPLSISLFFKHTKVSLIFGPLS